MTEEEEKKLARLEKRLVANVDFDDQALNLLGFGMDIYYMLGHRGWVQSSNGVSANTHREFTLEVLMTTAPILDEEMLGLSFSLEGVQQVVPYYGISWFSKRIPKTSGCAWRHIISFFWSVIVREAHQQKIVSGTLSSKCFTHGCVRGLWGE
jgi:hypothetical protein